MANEKGVWRTIGGRRVFIKDGEDLATAMKKSGKFDFKNKKGLTKEGEEKLKELEKDEEHKKSFNELLEQTTKADEEYELYKKAKENPDSIDPMTENSTDWEELDKKYSERYKNELQTKANKVVESSAKQKEEKNDGYQTYLRDRYGTENEDVVSAGYKNKEQLYQEYKDEVIRNINNERMKKGVTNINTAYKKAYAEYKRKHPNTKLSLEDFIKMSEE